MNRRILVVSDIHSNLEAFEAGWADAAKHGPYEAKLSAGDAIGYCSDPNPVLERLRVEGFEYVLGDHEEGIIGIYKEVQNLPKKDRQNRLLAFAQKCSSEREMQKRYVDCFNDYAIVAAVLNAAELTEENIEYLRGLSNKPFVDPKGMFAMVHGSFAGSIRGNPRHVVEGVYVTNEKEAAQAMEALMFFGGELTREEGFFMPNQLPEERENSNVAKLVDFKKGTQHVPIGIVGHTHIPMFSTCALPLANIKGVYKGYVHDFLRADPEDLELNRYFKGDTPKVGVNVNDLPKEVNRDAPDWFKVGYEGYASFDDLLRSVFLRKFLVNPGSVGQPRNGSPKARYMIIDLGENGDVEFRFKEVEYDVATTQRKMREKRYPEPLIARLEQGR